METASSKKPHPLSNTFSSNWDRSYLSDLPVSDSSLNNDPITSLPAEQLATFGTEQPQFSIPVVSDLPNATASGDEAVLKIKNSLLEDFDQCSNVKTENEVKQSNDPPAQYGFISQNYANKQNADSQGNDYDKSQVYEDLASPPPTVRFEPYVPVNKRIVKTSTRSKRFVQIF